MQRNSAIDIAKGIAIFLVIIGHQYDLPEISHFIYSFHMPLFFILGGYFFHKKKIKTDVLSNVRRLIFPYFLACKFNNYIRNTKINDVFLWFLLLYFDKISAN